MSRKYLTAIPLGGVNEVGRNCILYTYGDQAIMVDAGRKLIRENDVGYNDPAFEYPNFELLKSGKVELLGIFITHGHLDHLGALVAAEYYARGKARIFASAETTRFYGMHFDRDHGIKLRTQLQDKTEELLPGESISLGDFTISSFAVNHSILGARGYRILAGKKIAVHMGDAKMLGSHPVEPMQTATWQSLMSLEKKPDLLVLNAVNAGIPGFTPSEYYATNGVTDVIRRAHGRVIVAQFATNLARMECLYHAARNLGKTVGFAGGEHGAIRMAAELLKIGDARTLPHDGEVIFASGSQGEPWSALWRAAMDDPEDTRPHLHVSPRDTIIFSSRAIPPIKNDVKTTIERLQQTGAHIVLHQGESKKMNLATPAEEHFVHVSGHSQDEDLRLICNILQPKKILAHHADPETLEKLSGVLGPDKEIIFPNILDRIVIK